MELYLQFLFSAFSSLFIIVGPISAIPIFLTIVKNTTKEEIKNVARKSTVFAASVLIIFAFIGTFILDFFGITINAFKIAGGILIARIGFEMLYAKDTPEEKEDRRKSKVFNLETLALIPLAIPMLSGPGAMNTTIALMSNAKNIFEGVYVILAIVFVFLLSYYILINAIHIEKIMGEKGKMIFQKIMGLLTFVIGIQFIVNGFEGVLIGWGLIQILI